MNRTSDPLDREFEPLRQLEDVRSADPSTELMLLRSHRTGSFRPSKARLFVPVVGLLAIGVVLLAGWWAFRSPRVQLRVAGEVVRDALLGNAESFTYRTDEGVRIRVAVRHTRAGLLQVEIARGGGENGDDQEHDEFRSGTGPADAYPVRALESVAGRTPIYGWVRSDGLQCALFLVPVSASAAAVYVQTTVPGESPLLRELPGSMPSPGDGARLSFTIAGDELGLTLLRAGATTSLVWTGVLPGGAATRPSATRFTTPDGHVEVEIEPRDR